MKTFSIIKVGYTCGIYGCSGEYFNITIIDGEKIDTLAFYGLYGTEQRIANILKDAEFKEFYTPSNYGQLKLKETRGRFLSEEQAINKIKELIS